MSCQLHFLTSEHWGCARCLRQRSSPHAPCVLPSATEPSRRLLHLFGTVCRRQYVHRRHYQFSAEDWRLNFLSGLTTVLPHERLTVLTTMWPHIIVTCPCSPRTLCNVKSIRYHCHHHHHHQHFGCSVETLGYRMTDILNISHQPLISVDSRHESWVLLHVCKEKGDFLFMLLT